MMMITPVDKEAETNGTWVEYHGVQLKICRANNPVFKKAFLEHQAKLGSSSNSTEELKEKANIETLSEAISEGLLVDWQSFEVDGEVIPYSKENCKSLIVTDVDCRTFVIEYSNEMTNFYKDRVQKTLEK